MRTLLDLNCRLVFLCVICTARAALGCDQLPSGQSLWIRLSAPVSTYTAKAGDLVHAVLTQDLVCGNKVVFPRGAMIEGAVRSKRKVGWGIRHETANLELEFNSVTSGPGIAVALTARVEEVSNARESVRKGVIQGIRSSDTFQGRINSRLIHLPTWNPYSDPVLIAYKTVFPIFPEPEIYYPTGTDIRLRTTTELSSPPVAITTAQESSPPANLQSDELDQLVEQLPLRVTTRKDVAADLLNIVFLGSRQEVQTAFREAGWRNADPVSKRTMFKNMYALLNNSGYSQQPMMTFFLNGRPQDMSLQKSLNSYDRRDHLRIWQWTPKGTADSVWVSSSTHDTSAVLAVKYKGFVHHIAPDIDDERSTVIRDLTFAGCVKSVSYVARPDMPTTTHNATGDVMHTDGLMAVVALQSCKSAGPLPESGSFKPGNHAFRFMRRQILTFRNDIFRANVIYAVYDGGRMTWLALRR
ncbi:LssY C-terminal domain-containing protein [Edaphobacter modestus]|uniref:LssY-like putative type I secretion system component LssY n=1 Tax=Edaphobacter modestus TaxID=388466 RepID=A0A4Q7YXA7_9BACT|nr:LssY C-terminal domain-containing protein [Edaphobacter modestus]RZU41719.1 LssY-like putative type I secretion system component LssY [Edaphobacter modestus]